MFRTPTNQFINQNTKKRSKSWKSKQVSFGFLNLDMSFQ